MKGMVMASGIMRQMTKNRLTAVSQPVHPGRFAVPR